MRILTAALALILALPAAAKDADLSVTFYFQPDRSGANTQRTEIELDADGTLDIEESGEEANRLEKRTATAEERAVFEAVLALEMDRLNLIPSDDVDYPYVEIKVEYDTGALEVEIERAYPLGGVPAEYVSFQRLFFEKVFE